MTVYRGLITDGEAQVLVDNAIYVNQALDPRVDLRNHSPSGFAWGYGGSGPAQLALAILVHHLSGKSNAEIRQLAAQVMMTLTEVKPHEALALMFYQKFKFKVVGNLPQDQPFELTSTQVEDALRGILAGAT